MGTGGSGHKVYRHSAKGLRFLALAWGGAAMVPVVIAIAAPPQDKLAALPMLALVLALGLPSLRREVRAVQVTDEALRLYFWARRPVDIPWPDVMRVERPPRQERLQHGLADMTVYVSPRYGRRFNISYHMQDLYELYAQIMSRAQVASARADLAGGLRVFTYRRRPALAIMLVIVVFVPVWAFGTLSIAIQYLREHGDSSGYVPLAWVPAMLAVSAYLLRRCPRAVEVTDEGVTFHFWLRFRAPLAVPWSDVLKPERYPRRTGPGSIHVARRYGGHFGVSAQWFENMGDLYEVLSARAQG